MKNPIIEDILTEWAYRVDDGMPNPKNNLHLVHLKESLEHLKLDNDVIDIMMAKLYENASDKVYFQGDPPAGAKVQTGPRGGKYYMGNKETGEPATTEPDTNKQSNSDIQKDHEITDKQLNMTKKEAKEQAKKKGKKDVGAGTAESRAGEAMVHKGLRMIQEGKTPEDIAEFFTNLVQDDHVLNSKEGKKWIKAALATLNRIDEQIGWKNIKNVSWDTSEGRKAIGVDPDLETSSDMFIQTNDGTVVGLSLKKSGAVFLANKGWDKESEKLLAELKPSIPEEDFKVLEEAMSIETYARNLGERIATITQDVDDNYIDGLLNKLSTEDDKLISKYFGSGEKRDGYLNRFKDPNFLSRAREGNLSGEETKALAKLVAIYDTPRYEFLRQVDSDLTKGTFEALSRSPEATKAFKKTIVKSMHISETLGLNKKITEGGVDGFMTLYGIDPDGAVLNEEKLVDLFGSKFASVLGEIRAGNMTVDDLEEVIMESIDMDLETGNILFKHENENKYPLFFLKGRTRGLGVAPTMEMAQTNLMAYALKYGTFDSTKWPENIQAKFTEKIKQAPE